MVGAALATALASPLATPVGAQDVSTVIQLENPADEPVSTRTMISGWAADPSGEGTGVDIVQLYLGDPQDGGQLLGTATYGQPRPAAAEALGEDRFTPSGFEMAVELPPGEYTLYVYAHRNTAGPDEGWAVLSQKFTASGSVPPDPRAVALLGGDQPQVRSAAPPRGQASTNNSSNASPNAPASRSGIVSGGGVRTMIDPNDPMPLDPLGSAGGSIFVSPGRDGPELVDSMGVVPGSSGQTGTNGIRQSVASDTAPGTYRTGPVNLVGGSGTQCPGPNCPAAQNNAANALNNLPPDLVRDITGYNIPGVGSTQVCTPANVAGSVQGACNPVTGTASAPGAPTQADLMRQRAQQQMNSASPNAITQTPNTASPVCAQYAPNGQCVQPINQVSFNGSVCVAWAGTNCLRYEVPNQQAAAAGALTAPSTPLVPQQSASQQLTPQQLAALQGALGQSNAIVPGVQGAAPGTSGYLNTTSQYLNTSSGYLNSSSYLNTGATSGYTSSSPTTAINPYASNPYASNPYASTPSTAANYTAGSTSGGICLQFSASGQCMATR